MNGRPNDKSQGVKGHPACFAGLDDKELGALYRLAPIRLLQEGELLIREGDVDQIAYAVLEGELKVFRGDESRPEDIAVLGGGEWIGEIAFTKSVPRTASVKALSPSRVMVFNKAILAALDSKTQLHIYRQLNDLAARRVADLAAREGELAARNQALVNYISCKSRNRTDYGESEMIRGLIRKIPRLPDFALKLIDIVMDENSTPAEIGEVLIGSPQAANLLIETVNSTAFSFRTQMVDIHQVLAALGFHCAFQTSLSEAVKKTLPSSQALRPLMNESSILGHMCFALSMSCSIGDPAKAAALGILQNLGQCVIELLKEKNPNLTALIENLDSARLGALLLEDWGAPLILCEAVENQFKPEFAPPELIPEQVLENVLILYVSRLMLDYFRNIPEDETPTAFLADYMRVAGCGGLSIKDVLENKLMPLMKKKFSLLPLCIRELLAGGE